MKYWYKLSDNYDREWAKRHGEEVFPITLYPDSEEIRKEFYEHGGWRLLSDMTLYGDIFKCEFDSLEDAEAFFYLCWDGTDEEIHAFYDYLKTLS